MNREQFQQEHGAQFAQALNLPSVSSALMLLGIEVMDGIKNLTDEQIRHNSTIILSDIRGRLRYEASLLSLPIVPQEASPSLTEEYPVAVDEAFDQFTKNHPPS